MRGERRQQADSARRTVENRELAIASDCSRGHGVILEGLGLVVVPL